MARFITYLFQLHALLFEPQQHAIAQASHYLPSTTLRGIEIHAVYKGRVVLECLLTQVGCEHIVYVARHCLALDILTVPLDKLIVKGACVQGRVCVEARLETDVGMFVHKCLLQCQCMIWLDLVHMGQPCIITGREKQLARRGVAEVKVVQVLLRLVVRLGQMPEGLTHYNSWLSHVKSCKRVSKRRHHIIAMIEEFCLDYFGALRRTLILNKHDPFVDPQVPYQRSPIVGGTDHSLLEAAQVSLVSSFRSIYIQRIDGFLVADEPLPDYLSSLPNDHVLQLLHYF